MTNRRRTATGSHERAGSERFPESDIIPLEEFWHLMADACEAMSNDQLRAELAPVKAALARRYHSRKFH